MSDSSNLPPEPPDDPANGDEPEFTKEPQPELPLALRKKKAGWNWNRVLIWIIVGGFALYLIITGIVGILTKAR
ncbi:MAG TPA: hypothetical protein VHZ98_12040 [Galbitalea sp.]|nr:hypothetical protein [Galbitalea sp.]